MIFERSGARSVVGLAHDVPQNPFWLSRSFQAAIAAAFAGGRSIFQAINGCPNIALTTRPPVTAPISSSRSSRSSSLVRMMFSIQPNIVVWFCLWCGFVEKLVNLNFLNLSSVGSSEGGSQKPYAAAHCIQLAVRERAMIAAERAGVVVYLVLLMIFSIHAARTIHRWCGHTGSGRLVAL